MFALRAEIDRARDELELSAIELSDWLVALRAIGFDAQRERRGRALPIAISRKQTWGDGVNQRNASGDCAIAAGDSHRSRACRCAWRDLVIDLSWGDKEKWGEALDARAVLDLDGGTGKLGRQRGHGRANGSGSQTVAKAGAERVAGQPHQVEAGSRDAGDCSRLRHAEIEQLCANEGSFFVVAPSD